MVGVCVCGCVCPKVNKNRTPPGSLGLSLSLPPSLTPFWEKVDHPPHTHTHTHAATQVLQVALVGRWPGRTPSSFPTARRVCLGDRWGAGPSERGGGGRGWRRRGGENSENLNWVERGDRRRAKRTPRPGERRRGQLCTNQWRRPGRLLAVST